MNSEYVIPIMIFLTSIEKSISWQEYNDESDHCPYSNDKSNHYPYINDEPFNWYENDEESDYYWHDNGGDSFSWQDYNGDSDYWPDNDEDSYTWQENDKESDNYEEPNNWQDNDDKLDNWRNVICLSQQERNLSGQTLISYTKCFENFCRKIGQEAGFQYCCEKSCDDNGQPVWKPCMREYTTAILRETDLWGCECALNKWRSEHPGQC